MHTEQVWSLRVLTFTRSLYIYRMSCVMHAYQRRGTRGTQHSAQSDELKQQHSDLGFIYHRSRDFGHEIGESENITSKNDGHALTGDDDHPDVHRKTTARTECW